MNLLAHSTLWLDFTNAGLGAICLLCLLIVLFAILGEFARSKPAPPRGASRWIVLRNESRQREGRQTPAAG